MPDQAPSPLLERNRRLRQRVGCKRFATRPLDVLGARLHQRISRGWKRQLVDDHQLQSIARHIKPVPERSRGHQHTTRSAVGCAFAKTLHQAPLGPLTLHQHLQRARGLPTRFEGIANGAQGLECGGQHQRAPAQRLGGQRNPLRHAAAVGRIRRRWQLTRHIQGRLSGIVKRTGHAKDACILQSRSFSEPGQGLISTQRRRRENPRPAHVCGRLFRPGFALRGFCGRRQNPGAHGICNVQRRLDQAQLVAHIEPTYRIGLTRARKPGQPCQQCTATFVQALQIGRYFAHRVQRLQRLRTCRSQYAQRGMPRSVR